MKSVRAKMFAQWWGWNPATNKFDSDEGHEIVDCSIAEKRINVWLPGGARIILRNSRCYDDRERYLRNNFWYHYYGSHERMTRTRIKFWIKDGEKVLP